MATIIDDTNDENTETEKFANLEEVETESTETVSETEAEETNAEGALPEKYQGKSTAEVVRMHQEAEKRMGQQSSEVGELRRIVDDFIAGTISNTPEEPEEKVDFFDDPEKAVAQAVAKHPDVVAAKQQAQRADAAVTNADALRALQSAHPDVNEVYNDPAFGEWVVASPFRTRLFTQANDQFDLEAADTLLNLYKEQKSINKQTVETEKKERKQQVREANTGNTRGSGERSTKKVYRRTDVIALMRDNPKRYAEMADEIALAYQEKRVK